MKITSIVLSALFLSLAVAYPAAADTRSVNFTSVAGWDVDAVYAKETNQFSFCTASAQYRDLTYFMITLDYSGGWHLALFNKSWPSNLTGTIPVTLIVDNTVIDRSEATWTGNGAIINFGQAVEKVVALMRGRGLEVATARGSSKFRLDGSFKASLAVLECWKLHSGGTQSAGAFGGTQSTGAFGGTQSEVSSSSRQDIHLYSRAETLEVAAAYLGNSNITYKILPEKENFFDNLPVNWRYGDSSLGGMLILGGNVSGEKVFVKLLEDQTRLCTGKSGISRVPAYEDGGYRYYLAKGMCEVNGDSFSAVYEVTEGKNFAVVIIEMVDDNDAVANPKLNKPKPADGGLLAKFDLN